MGLALTLLFLAPPLVEAALFVCLAPTPQCLVPHQQATALFVEWAHTPLHMEQWTQATVHCAVQAPSPLALVPQATVLCVGQAATLQALAWHLLLAALCVVRAPTLLHMEQWS